MTNVVGPVPASVADRLQPVSVASTVTSAGAAALVPAGFDSLAVQPAMATPARIAATVAVPVLNFTWSTFR